MTRCPAHDLQTLLAEEPFVRGLACALASHDADDVAQQTWLLALQHRGPVQQPRSWLRRIATNVANNLARSERRRGERELSAARCERAPSSAELMEREERRSALVRAVDRLPVELREVVLLRWFEGLPPRRIAAALGLPVTTVWNRLRSALQRLREGLDREHGGDRRAWLLPLLPRAFPGEAGPAMPLLLAGGWVMTTKTKVAVLLGVVLLLGGGFAFWPETSPVDPALPPGASPAVAAASAPGTSGALDPASATAERVVVPTGPAAASTGALLVHVLRGDDRSAASNETLILSPLGVDSPTAATLHRTDDVGQVRVDSLVPGILKVSLLQYPRPKRVEIRAGQLTEFDYVLPAGVAVSGIVVDADERGIDGAEVDLVDFGSEQPTPVATTDAEGRFALRHVWPLSLIGARSAKQAASRLQMVSGTDGAAIEIKIQLLAAGCALEGTVWGPDQRPVAGALVRVGSDRLSGTVSSLGVDPVAVPVRSDSQGRFRSVGLKAGEQRVFVRASGLAPWQGPCFLASGSTAAMRIDLTAGAACNGVVRDEAGTPLAGVEVRTGKGSEFTGCGAETASDGSFTLTGLAVGDLEVRAEHQQFGATKAVVATRAGATVTCDLVLSRGIELRGRVLDQQGVGISDVHVIAHGSAASTEGRTDAEGRFTLVNCPPGLVTVSAYSGEQEARREQVDPRQGEIELRLTRAAPPQPASVRIRGQLIGADGRGVAGVTVTGFAPILGSQPGCATEEDGTFALGPLVPGKWTVYVPAQRYPSWASGARELAADAVWDLGRVQLVAGGTALVEVLGASAGSQVQFSIRDAAGGHGSGQWLEEHVLRTWALAPGEYRIHLAADGCARRWVPFTIRAGEETRVQARLEPGVRQRFEFVRADGARLGDPVHGLRRGAEVLIEMGNVLYSDRPPVYAADGAMTAELWLAPGTYRLDAGERDVAGSAEFTVTASEGPAVRIVLR